MPEPSEQHEFSFKKFFVPFTTTKAIHYLFFLGIVVFCNGLFNNFLGDDLGQIVDNVAVHSFTSIPSFFSGSTFYNGGGANLIGLWFRPLPLSFFSILYSFFGSNPFA